MRRSSVALMQGSSTTRNTQNEARSMHDHTPPFMLRVSGWGLHGAGMGLTRTPERLTGESVFQIVIVIP